MTFLRLISKVTLSFKLTTFAFIFAVPSFTQSISSSPSTAVNGQVVSWAVSGPSGPSVVKASFKLPILQNPSAVIPASIKALGKRIDCKAPVNSIWECTVSGAPNVPLPSGIVFILSANVVNATGSPIPTDASQFVFTAVQTPSTNILNCDRNGDGVVNLADVQIVANAVIDLDYPPQDVNGDGVTDDADYQIVRASALVGTCTFIGANFLELQANAFVASEVPDYSQSIAFDAPIRTNVVCLVEWGVAWFDDLSYAAPIALHPACYSDFHMSEVLADPAWKEWYDAEVAKLAG